MRIFALIAAFVAVSFAAVPAQARDHGNRYYSEPYHWITPHYTCYSECGGWGYNYYPYLPSSVVVEGAAVEQHCLWIICTTTFVPTIPAAPAVRVVAAPAYAAPVAYQAPAAPVPPAPAATVRSQAPFGGKFIDAPVGPNGEAPRVRWDCAGGACSIKGITY